MDLNINELIALEKDLEEKKVSVCEAICAEIEKQLLPGVTKIDGPIHAFAVSSSAILNSGSFNLSPRFYSQRSQALAVRDALLSAARKGGFAGLLSQLELIIQRKQVTVAGDTIGLNPATLSVLKNALVELT